MGLSLHDINALKKSFRNMTKEDAQNQILILEQKIITGECTPADYRDVISQFLIHFPPVYGISVPADLHSTDRIVAMAIRANDPELVMEWVVHRQKAFGPELKRNEVNQKIYISCLEELLHLTPGAASLYKMIIEGFK